MPKTVGMPPCRWSSPGQPRRNGAFAQCGLLSCVVPGPSPKESIMLAKWLLAAFVLFCSAATADDSFLLQTDRTSATDGYWNTDQGYFVGCYHHPADRGAKGDERHLRVVSVRLGLVHGGRLHPGPFAVDSRHLDMIQNMSLVLREGDTVTLRVPVKAEVDPGNHVHLHLQFHASAEQLLKMEVEFEEHLDSGTRRMRIPLKQFSRK